MFICFAHSCSVNNYAILTNFKCDNPLHIQVVAARRFCFDCCICSIRQSFRTSFGNSRSVRLDGQYRLYILKRAYISLIGLRQLRCQRIIISGIRRILERVVSDVGVSAFHTAHSGFGIFADHSRNRRLFASQIVQHICITILCRKYRSDSSIYKLELCFISVRTDLAVILRCFFGILNSCAIDIHLGDVVDRDLCTFKSSITLGNRSLTLSVRLLEFHTAANNIIYCSTGINLICLLGIVCNCVVNLSFITDLNNGIPVIVQHVAFRCFGFLDEVSAIRQRVGFRRCVSVLICDQRPYCTLIIICKLLNACSVRDFRLSSFFPDFVLVSSCAIRTNQSILSGNVIDRILSACECSIALRLVLILSLNDLTISVKLGNFDAAANYLFRKLRLMVCQINHLTVICNRKRYNPVFIQQIAFRRLGLTSSIFACRKSISSDASISLFIGIDRYNFAFVCQ